MTPRYSNGEVPERLLITFATGWLPVEGTWKHQLPPSSYRKHLALVALAKKNTGRTLKVSEGWGAYRPRRIQVYARKIHGRWAAVPGTSSHGMFWENRQCAATDYGNWGYVYNWDRAAFYRDVRAVGLVPGLISESRGYPDEPWHVVDLDPWAAVPAGGGSFVPEEDDMTPEQANQLEQIYKAVFKGGPSMQEGGNSIAASLAKIYGAVKPIRRGGRDVALRQEVADTKTIVAGLEAGIQALAVAKGADPAAILKAVQDGVETAMRKVTFTADVDG